MFTSFMSQYKKNEIENKRLSYLVQETLLKTNVNPKTLLMKIKKLVENGADLNQQINKKNLTYLLLMHIADFEFAQEIMDLGGDPRILNDDKTNLFLPPPEGRGIFMQVCWLDYIHSNFEIGNHDTNYANIVKAALLIYMFCTVKELQILHDFSLTNNISLEGLQVYRNIEYFEKHLDNFQFQDIQKIQRKYLFYSTCLAKSPAIHFEVLPKHDEAKCSKVVRFR